MGSLCVLGDLCGKTFLTRARPKKQRLSQPDLPIRIWSVSRRGRGGVFDIAIEVGRGHALFQAFFEGGFGVYLPPAVHRGCRKADSIPALPIHTCASARSLPIPIRKPFDVAL
jgi:hypothetical protein